MYRLYFKLCCKAYSWKTRAVRNVVRNVSGMGTVEVIIIIAVLVALALLFRDFITELATDIFSKIREKTESAIDSL